MRDHLINALDTLKLQLQTMPSASSYPGLNNRELHRIIDNLDRSIEEAKSGQMIKALKILENG